MTSPELSVPELIAAAQKGGWHKDPLGRDIIAALVQRQNAGSRPRRQILALSFALAISLGLLVYVYVQNTHLEEQVASGVRAGLTAEAHAQQRVADLEKLAAAGTARADDSLRQRDAMIAVINHGHLQNVEKLTNNLSTLTKEIEALRLENAVLKAAATKP